MRLGIIIPTPDLEHQHFQRCSARIAATTRHLNVGIHPIVSSGPGFRFARSVNQGIEADRDADAWVVVNDDCFVDDGWLDAMLGVVGDDSRVGIVGALLRSPDGRIQHAGGFLTTGVGASVLTSCRFGFYQEAARILVRRLADWNPGAAYKTWHHLSVESTGRLDFITGACALFTRDLYEAIGGWDEDFPFGWEDVDFSLRALEAGFRLRLAAKAGGVHLDRASGRQRMQPAEIESARVFRRQWPIARIRALPTVRD